MLSPVGGKLLRGRHVSARGCSHRFFAHSLDQVSLQSAREYDIDEEWLDRVTDRAMEGSLLLHSLDPFEDVIAPLGVGTEESDSSSHPVASGGLLDAELLPLPVSVTRDFLPQAAAARGLDQGVLTPKPLAKGTYFTDEQSYEKTVQSKVSPAAAPSAEIVYEPDEESAKEVFISSIRFGTSKTQIREVFSRCGEVVSVKLPLDATRRKIRGIGFVAFAEESSVLLAVDTLNDYELNGRRIRVRRNRGKVPIGRKQALQRQRVDKQKLLASPLPSDSLTVFVGNLPFETSADALRALIEKSGVQVVDCRIVTDSEGKSRGFAYVDLADAKSMRAAVARVSGMVVGGRVVRVDYSARAKAGKKASAKRSSEASPKKAEALELENYSSSAPLPPIRRRPPPATLTTSRTLPPLSRAPHGYYQYPSDDSHAYYRRSLDSHSAAAFESAFLRADDAHRGHEYGHGHEVYGASAAATRPMSALSEHSSARQMFHERAPTTAVPLQYGYGSEQQLLAEARMSDPRCGVLISAPYPRVLVLADGRRLRLVWTPERGYTYTL